MNSSRTHSAPVFAALTTVQVLFGINYVVSKVIVGIFPPLVWASFRVLVSTVALFLIAILSKRPRPQVNARYLFSLAFFSLLGVVINQASFLVGLSLTTSTNSAILNTMIPVFTLLLVTISGQEPLTLKRTVGFFLAFGGVLAIRK